MTKKRVMRAKILLLNFNDEWQYRYFPTRSKALKFKRDQGLFSDVPVEKHVPMSERKKKKKRRSR